MYTAGQFGLGNKRPFSEQIYLRSEGKNRAPKTNMTEGSEAFIYVRIDCIFVGVCVCICRYLPTYTPA